MDLEFTAAERAFREECRGWLGENVTPLPSGDTPEGFALCKEFEHKLFDAGLAVVHWPREYGGRGGSLVEWLIFEEEYFRAGAPQRVSQNGVTLLAPTLFEFGTGEQKARVLQKMARADELWAQGWSEPNAGSDLAGIAARAERDDRRGGWRLHGQKTWCSRGAFCDFLFGLFRSDPKAERHRGLTYLMVPLHAEGVAVRPVRRLDGEPGFAEVFFEDAFVPDRDVIGGLHQGWKVAMATASSERGLSLRSPGRFCAAAARLVGLWRRVGKPAALREEVARAWIDAEAYNVYTLSTITRISDGESLGASSSMNKIFWSELDVRIHALALRLLGAEAELDGAWMRGWQFALAGPIYAGTNEVQRNIVAERVLGLPKGK